MEKKKSVIFFKGRQQKISNDDLEIVVSLEKLKKEINYLHSALNYVTDPTLIDSFIFETLALNMRYKYYLNLCKERGLVAEGF